MSEIEFRLERTPVDESDDEVQHDDVPTGRCIAPVFSRKLRNFRAVEGVPVTFSCRVLGIPSPKVKGGGGGGVLVSLASLQRLLRPCVRRFTGSRTASRS